MKRMSFVSLGDLRGSLCAVKSWMGPLHTGFATKDPKRTKVQNHEAHVLCVPW